MSIDNTEKQADMPGDFDINKEIDGTVEPFDPEKPESVILHFFLFILKGECDTSWKLFSEYSQQKIIDNTYEDMQNSDESYLQDEISSKEDLKKAFEDNNKILKEAFWLPFAMNSNADYMIEFAEYNVESKKDNKAIVEAIFKRHDGLESKLPFKMIYENSSWRLGIIESAEDNQPL